MTICVGEKSVLYWDYIQLVTVTLYTMADLIDGSIRALLFTNNIAALYPPFTIIIIGFLQVKQTHSTAQTRGTTRTDRVVP